MPAEAPPGAIELEGVAKTFGGKEVLRGIDLEVPAGEITVLLGPSGAGKTVTISHIVGLLQPTRGRVKVEGRDLGWLTDEELNEVRQRMAVVVQGTLPFSCGLFFSLDIFENVAFPLRQRTRMTEDEIRETVLGYLGMVGLRDRASAMPDELSAGMAKRAAIARALALEAPIVIIDDFDSGIDGVRLSLLCEILAEAQRSAHSTMLVSTHSMSAARRLADRVAVIHDGSIAASGPADEVFDSAEPLVHQLVTGGTSGPIGLRDV
jgi:phospholipid/cholesterol/gamma-HCH transport system ATP-binding protein